MVCQNLIQMAGNNRNEKYIQISALVLSTRRFNLASGKAGHRSSISGDNVQIKQFLAITIGDPLPFGRCNDEYV